MTFADFPRRSLLFALGLLQLLVMLAKPLAACSPAFIARADPELQGATVPSNAVFSFRHYENEAVSAELFDPQSKPVPAELVTTILPEVSFLEEPYYSVLHPFEPLAPGTYRLVLGGRRSGVQQPYIFSVKAEFDNMAPAPPQNLSVDIEIIRVPVGVRPNCSVIRGNRPYLRLRFKQPLDERKPIDSLLYEVTVTANAKNSLNPPRSCTIAGLRLRTLSRSGPNLFLQVDPKKSAPATDGETLLIPLRWLHETGMDPPLQITLHAVDQAGNKSDAAIAVQGTLGQQSDTILRSGETGQPAMPQRTLPIDALQARDLERLKTAIISEDDLLVINYLAPLLPSPVGTRLDTAFAGGLLAREGNIYIEASLKAAEERSTILLPAIVKNAKISLGISSRVMKDFVAALPLDDPTVKKLIVRFDTQQRAWTYLQMVDGASHFYEWSPVKPVDIRASLQQTK